MKNIFGESVGAHAWNVVIGEYLGFLKWAPLVLQRVNSIVLYKYIVEQLTGRKMSVLSTQERVRQYLKIRLSEGATYLDIYVKLSSELDMQIIEKL